MSSRRRARLAVGLRVAAGWAAGLALAGNVQAQISPEGVVAPAEAASEEMLKPPQRTGMFRWGGFEFFPRASAQACYDDNILINSTKLLSDFIWAVSPGLALKTWEHHDEPGMSLSLDYSPTFKAYTQHGQYDAIDQAAALAANWTMARLTLGLSQGVSYYSGPVADVGNLITSLTLRTGLTSKYDLSDRTSVEVNGGYDNYSYEDPRYIGYRVWQNNNWVNRQISSKVTGGFGLTFGYVDVDRNPSQTFEQALLRLLYRVTGKVDLSVAGGGEWRQYGGDVPDTIKPIMAIAGTYTPSVSTAFTLEAHRKDQPSAYYEHQNYVMTGFSLGVRQQIVSRYFVTLQAGYDNAEYHATSGGPEASRTDNLYSARVGMECRLSQRWLASVFYQYQRDNSNAGFSYDVNRVGLQTSWAY